MHPDWTKKLITNRQKFTRNWSDIKNKRSLIQRLLFKIKNAQRNAPNIQISANP
jgi:hypothetical protein